MFPSRRWFPALAVVLGACSSAAPPPDQSTASALEPNVESDGLDTVKAWATRHTREGEQRFRSAGGSRFTPGRPWSGEVVYSIQVDRFNDGDPSNNNANIEAFQKEHQGSDNLYGLPSYRHGGDLRGVIDRLDYIKDLGATALWLTPVLQHAGSYHGYCTTNFAEIDPGFGSAEDFRELVQQAHARGLRVVMDIVVNHMCDNETRYRKAANHSACADDLQRMSWAGEGGGSRHQGELEFGKSFFGPLKSPYFFNRCGANSGDDTSGIGAPAVYGDFVSSMLDFDTRNYDFQDIFSELHKYWIGYADIDGFRVDAAKHVTEDFLAAFSTQVRAYAESIGKKDFYLVGEVAGPADWMARRVGTMMSDPKNPDRHGEVPASLTQRLRSLAKTYQSSKDAPYPGLNAVYNFPQGGTARDTLLNAAPTRSLEDQFTSEGQRTLAAQGDPNLHWTVLEIHDWPRFVSTRGNDPYKSRLGLSYLATAPGIPVIYYGMEQGFNGACPSVSKDVGDARREIEQVCNDGASHERYRQDMFLKGPWRLGSTVPEVQALARVGRVSDETAPTWEKDPYLSRDHEVYQTARRMMRLRSSCSPLSRGQTVYRWGEFNREGIFAFSRIDAGREMVVVVNTSPSRLAIPGELELDGTLNQRAGEVYESVLPDGSKGIVRLRDGRAFISFDGQTLDGNSVTVFAHRNNLQPLDAALGVRLCRP